jgi:small subunit ribosomal protein S17
MADENEIEIENDTPDVSEPEAAETEVDAQAETAEEAVAVETGDEPEASEDAPEPEASAGDEPEVSEDAPEPEAAEAAPAAAAEPKRKKKRLPRSLRPARTRPKRQKSAERKPIVRLPKPEGERGRRQERQGTVVSSAMDKTIVVKVDAMKAHPKYQKVVRRSRKFHAHDEANEAKVGDVVRIVETRPLSATKRWRLVEIVEAAK